MSRLRIAAFALLAACALFVPHASAVESLDQLLEQTRNSRAEKANENAAREKEFLANRNEQAALLADAQRQRDGAEARS